jgi:hypothetical protein
MTINKGKRFFGNGTHLKDVVFERGEDDVIVVDTRRVSSARDIAVAAIIVNDIV